MFNHFQSVWRAGDAHSLQGLSTSGQPTVGVRFRSSWSRSSYSSLGVHLVRVEKRNAGTQGSGDEAETRNFSPLQNVFRPKRAERPSLPRPLAYRREKRVKRDNPPPSLLASPLAVHAVTHSHISTEHAPVRSWKMHILPAFSSALSAVCSAAESRWLTSIRATLVRRPPLPPKPRASSWRSSSFRRPSAASCCCRGAPGRRTQLCLGDALPAAGAGL